LEALLQRGPGDGAQEVRGMERVDEDAVRLLTREAEHERADRCQEDPGMRLVDQGGTEGIGEQVVREVLAVEVELLLAPAGAPDRLHGLDHLAQPGSGWVEGDRETTGVV